MNVLKAIETAAIADISQGYSGICHSSIQFFKRVLILPNNSHVASLKQKHRNPVTIGDCHYVS